MIAKGLVKRWYMTARELVEGKREKKDRQASTSQPHRPSMVWRTKDDLYSRGDYLPGEEYIEERKEQRAGGAIRPAEVESTTTTQMGDTNGE